MLIFFFGGAGGAWTKFCNTIMYVCIENMVPLTSNHTDTMQSHVISSIRQLPKAPNSINHTHLAKEEPK